MFWRIHQKAEKKNDDYKKTKKYGSVLFDHFVYVKNAFQL